MHKLWEFFVKNRQFTTIIVIAVVLMGILSAVQLPKESDPEVDIPVGVVSIGFPGASPRDTEELITNRVEDKVLSLDGVSKVTSRSRDGFSIVTVEFNANLDSDEQIQKLKEKIDEITDLPDEANDPIVKQVSFADRPVYTFALSGPFSVQQLKLFAEDLKSMIERVNGVSEVNISGGEEREIQVLVNRALLDTYGIGLSQVTSAIRRANTDIPTGTITTGDERFSVRFAGSLTKPQEIVAIPIAEREGVPITVADVAIVKDTFKERTSISRLSVDGSEPQPAVSLQILKVGVGNVIEMVDAINMKIEEAKRTFLPENITIETVEDRAEFIRRDLGKLVSNGFQTIGIIAVLLFIFLGWREAILASIAIPLTFLITFSLLLAAGMTLNFLSLFSLILALGILVDSAIVVTEGMYSHIASGKNPRDAAIATIREFDIPLITGTLTTVFAFLPMLMTSGIMGQFIRSIPITVSNVLMASLFVALGVVTTFGARFFKVKPKKRARESFVEVLREWYEQIFDKLLNRKWLRRGFFTALFALFVGSMALPVTGILPVNMFPAGDVDFFYIEVEKPIGSVLDVTNDAVKPLEAQLTKDSNIASFIVNIGGGNDRHQARFTVNLKKERDETSTALVQKYSDILPKLTDAEVSVLQISSGPGDSAPVEITIAGKSFETLREVGKTFQEMLATIPGTRDVQISEKQTHGEFVLRIDRAKAQIFGVSTTDLALLLRNAVSGTKATVIRHEGDSTDVVVKYDLPQTTVASLEGLTVATRSGEVPLSAFIKSSLEPSSADIQHEDGDRIVKVTSRVKEGFAAQQIFVAAQAQMPPVPDGYFVRMGGEREDIDQSFADMFRAMILAIFLIGALLVWQFKSYRQPLFILMTIPFALIGVFPGLVVIGLPLSFPGIIGIVALTGIVVNNAIILVDKINENRRNGMEKQAAIAAAGKARLQPIILTTITTVMGVLPLALGDATWGPLGFSIIFGLLFSTVLTLLVIPLLYASFGEKHLERID